MFGIWDVLDVGYSKMLDVWDVGCLESGLFSIWGVHDVDVLGIRDVGKV